MTKPKFYITTSIAYANAAPHIGFALELLIADAIARYQRLLGKEVYFLTGTDEHGIKIYNAAAAAGKTPQAYVDEVSGYFRDLCAALNISHTDFIRTTDKQRHWPTAQKAWSQLAAKGDIYLGHYQGYYCVNDEAYITATDFESGAYANKTVIELSEDNYMLRLSDYQARLQEQVGTQLAISPAHRAKEIRNFISEGVEDISVSRQVDKLPWGIPIPGDDRHVMYVWSDALTNYISALGYAEDSENFKRFWPADVQVIGKDILRFHAVIWPAILMGLGLGLPKKLLVHGFVNNSGEKMSKSLGNVVGTNELIDRYGVEATRYYLLSQIPTFDDGDYSDARMLEVYTADLANDLGNLLSRVLTLAHKYMPDGISAAPTQTIGDGWLESWREQMEAMSIDKACAHIWEAVRAGNVYVDQNKPWELAKSDQAAATQVVINLLDHLRQISVALYPTMPQTSDRIRTQLGLSAIDPSTQVLEELLQASLATGASLGSSEILFPRIEEAS